MQGVFDIRCPLLIARLIAHRLECRRLADSVPRSRCDIAAIVGQLVTGFYRVGTLNQQEAKDICFGDDPKRGD